MTDTDSLIYGKQTEDIYNHMIKKLEPYDTSDYPNDYSVHSNENKKVLSKIKDEMNGMPIKEFVGLRPKMYSLVKENNSEKKTAKGISRAITREMRHNDYKRYNRALFVEKSEIVTMDMITSSNQDIKTCTIIKVGPLPYDDKRFVMND